jgi:hypothetical protein
MSCIVLEQHTLYLLGGCASLSTLVAVLDIKPCPVASKKDPVSCYLVRCVSSRRFFLHSLNRADKIPWLFSLEGGGIII